MAQVQEERVEVIELDDDDLVERVVGAAVAAEDEVADLEVRESLVPLVLETVERWAPQAARRELTAALQREDVDREEAQGMLRAFDERAGTRAA